MFFRRQGIYVLIIEKNESFEITEIDGKVFLQTFKLAYPLKDFDKILRSQPRLKLSNFAVLKNTLMHGTEKPVEIGYWLPNIEIEVAPDKMTASFFVHETIEYIRQNKEQLKNEIIETLHNQGIVHGIIDFDLDNVISGKAFLVAKGTPPTKGEDAVITYLPKPERKPVIREDGKANYFDLNFISEITEGTWLGEKIPAKPGENGVNVLGEVLEAPHGRDATLKYDNKSAYEVEEIGKIVLRSKISGVLEHGKSGIGVNKHLPINGDVGVGTGNIEFDGSISIKGTVSAGYTVIATGDISIEGIDGVSGAKLIKSIEGDVYIRGGIFGLGNTTIVEAGGNIFVKHINEANLFAANTIHIGSYTLGSNINANTVIVDERKGKIIGGSIVAKTSITTAIAGNRLERKTELIIEAINKSESYAELQLKASTLNDLQSEIATLEDQLKRLEPLLSKLNKEQTVIYEETKQSLTRRKAEALHFDREIKIMMEELRYAGNEFINVTKEAYPGTYIQIGKKSSVLSKLTNGKFCIELGELNV